MMDFKDIKIEASDVWNEYQKGVTYLHKKELYNTVKQNEKFFDGNQWEGLETKSEMPRPVFNVLQRAGKYMVATIGSNDIAISMTPYTTIPDDVTRFKAVSKAIDDVIEHARIKEKSKVIIRNAFVDGAGYLLLSFNPNIETGQPMKGAVEAQIVDNTNMYYGNPYSSDIQTQPYIIVAIRQHISQVKAECRRLGFSQDQIDDIHEDNDTNQVNNEDSDGLVTVLLKYFKYAKEVEDINVDKYTGERVISKHYEETVWFTKCTQNITMIPPTDLGYKRYPIACFGWDIVKNSYLYSTPLTHNIVNQIYVNKMFAIMQLWTLQGAFPKRIYDKNKVDIDEFLDSTSMAVSGTDMMGEFLKFISPPDFSPQAIQLTQEVIAQMKENFGVTDASLGNVKPDNTSAIIALQESSNVPLEIQKQNFYEFWEDLVRNTIDIVACTYGVRDVMTDDIGLATVDFSTLKDLNYNLTVEIGTGAQFSEIAQMQTLDKLVQAGFIPATAYMRAVPSKYIPQKQMLIQANQEMMAQGVMPTPTGSTTANETPAL